MSRARHPWFYTLPVALTLAGPRAVPARPIAPVAVPEFAVLAELLRERQGIDLGGPAGDDRGSASVPHSQQFGTGEGMFPVAESASRRSLALPFHTRLSAGDQERVVEALARALSPS